MPNILYFVFISECVESVLQFGGFFSSQKVCFGFFFPDFFGTCSDVVGWKVKLPRYTVPVVPYLQKDAARVFSTGWFRWTGIGRKRYVHETRSTTKVFSPRNGWIYRCETFLLFKGEGIFQVSCR